MGVCRGLFKLGDLSLTDLHSCRYGVARNLSTGRTLTSCIAVPCGTRTSCIAVPCGTRTSCIAVPCGTRTSCIAVPMWN
uniref:Uncharacterized protein n=1 Tax=Anguilla anguilla TaxID=7936 RepID=A0A0E9Q322_ANGAN